MNRLYVILFCAEQVQKNGLIRFQNNKHVYRVALVSIHQHKI